jgi:hypothetical protein
MASWSLLTALSGYTYDLGAGLLGFSPRLWPEDFRTFWSADGVWGNYAQQTGAGARVSLRVDYGRVTLNGLDLGALGEARLTTVTAAGGACPATFTETPEGVRVRFERPVTLTAGDELVLG